MEQMTGHTCFRIRRSMLAMLVGFSGFLPYPPACLHAQSPSRPTVLVAVRQQGNPTDSSYRGLIEGFVRVELEHGGLGVLAEDVDELDGSADAPVLLERAAAGRADFLLSCIYRLHQNDIAIDFSWVEVDRRRLAVQLSRTQSLNLSFDNIIRDGIHAILQAEEPLLAELASRPPPPTLAEPPPLEAELAAAAIEPEVGKPEAPLARAPRRWELSYGMAPFLATGQASGYFKTGLFPSFSVDYRLPLGSSLLGVGLYAGVCWFQARGILFDSSTFLIPLGLDLRYALAEERPLGLFVRVSGGAALFTIDPGGRGRQFKVIPYILGGIGLVVPFSRASGLVLEPMYAAFLEPQGPISGFTPSGYLYVRL